ncbi:MAG: hypothetical protein C0172_01000 [Caldisphaera sp.]|jgi:hypothetical protein|uniref:hypothetical protein n=1 Tax=Caldisphaera sp. TaxID=2060322 RepID=UPI000CA8CBD0|nr:MAG: hypothetical protein C0202_00995 [Caldisphaera sp.]PMP89044.1 MAG: hypothetical protein C0172_01000 [Caldisphaera sp.]
MSKCSCEEKSKMELISCLAPPAGEYEAQIDLGSNRKLIINSDGIFLRTYSLDDFLPFIQTRDLKIKERDLDLFKISMKDMLCSTINALLDASNHSSIYAKEKVNNCAELIGELINYCKQK